ncbi:YdcH family protein [Tepidicaulis sp.]|uniref:YdcH family protein n=1 Tax=Tepidicaulis sp. TaxID=1920809 RepID=UPI003B59EE19
MDSIDEEELRTLLIALKEEHRDLDTAIMALEALTYPDHLQIKRLKKKKLELRDRILNIEDELFPDIIA